MHTERMNILLGFIEGSTAMRANAGSEKYLFSVFGIGGNKHQALVLFGVSLEHEGIIKPPREASRSFGIK